MLNFALKKYSSDYLAPLENFLVRTKDLSPIALSHGLEKSIQENRWDLVNLLAKKGSFQALSIVIYTLVKERSSKLSLILDAIKTNHNFKPILVNTIINSADDKEGVCFLINELLASTYKKNSRLSKSRSTNVAGIFGLIKMKKIASRKRFKANYPLDLDFWNAFISSGQNILDQVMIKSDLDQSRLETLQKVQDLLKENPDIRGPFFFGIMLLNVDFKMLEILIQRVIVGKVSPLDFAPLISSKSKLTGSGRNVFRIWKDLCAMNATDSDNPFFHYVLEKDESLRRNYLIQNIKYAMKNPGFAKKVSGLIIQIPKKAQTIMEDMKLQIINGDLSFVDHISQDQEIVDLIPLAIETAAKMSKWNQVLLLSEFDPKTAIRVSRSKMIIIENILQSAMGRDNYPDLLEYVFSLAEENKDIFNTFYRF